MAAIHALLESGIPRVVGSFGDPGSLRHSRAEAVSSACDIVELRLDVLCAAGERSAALWQHLREMPLLFTARRHEEGGALALDAAERTALMLPVLDEASLIDLEAASIDEMGPLIEQAAARNLPWIASFHDFERLPETAVLERALDTARQAGAAAFKLAARLDGPAAMARLAEFQLQDHGLPVATMGMGPLAAVSRLLCAQCGSVLNYGYIGATPTAPGQWDARSLKEAIAKLTAFRQQP